MFNKYEDYKNKFDIEIKNFFGEGNFEEILNYSIESGKRIRPIILMETFKMLSGENIQQALKYAISLELIHNYSLIHDDLPDMDNDNYRRGRKTTHYKYGADKAILAGDTLLNFAFEFLLENLVTSPDTYSIKAAKLLAEYAGYKGMIGGQIQDIENKFDTLEDLIEMYKNKTCKLFMAATAIPAYLTHQDDYTIEKMKELGFYIGMAFQLQDDILDSKQDSEISKITYLTFKGKDETIKDMNKFTDDALKILYNYGNNNFLVELINVLKNRTI